MVLSHRKVEITSMQHVLSSVVLELPHAVRSAWVTGFHPSLKPLPVQGGDRSCHALLFRTTCHEIQNSRYSVTPRPSALRSIRLSPDILTTTASADFSPTLMGEISPGKALVLSPHAARLYPLCLDSLRASLFLASSPSTTGLSVCSCSCGRGFAFRFLQPAPHGLGLAVRLRLPLSAPATTLTLLAQAHAGHTRAQ